MIDKIIAFCKNKKVKIVTLTIFAVASAILIIGGLTSTNLAGLVEAVVGVLSAIATLIKLIESFLTKNLVIDAIDSVKKEL